MRDRIMRELAACNGGPGLTTRELAAATLLPDALIRNALASLVFGEMVVTCDRDGRYKLGDPSALLVIG